MKTAPLTCFSGDEYVRYSTDDYRYVDEEYPKKIAQDLASEPAFRYMPKEFQYELNNLEEKNSEVFIDAVVGNQRSLYAFVNKQLFVSTESPTSNYTITGIGKVRNNFQTRGVVDAGICKQQRSHLPVFR